MHAAPSLSTEEQPKSMDEAAANTGICDVHRMKPDSTCSSVQAGHSRQATGRGIGFLAPGQSSLGTCTHWAWPKHRLGGPREPVGPPAMSRLPGWQLRVLWAGSGRVSGLGVLCTCVGAVGPGLAFQSHVQSAPRRCGRTWRIGTTPGEQTSRDQRDSRRGRGQGPPADGRGRIRTLH